MMRARLAAMLLDCLSTCLIIMSEMPAHTKPLLTLTGCAAWTLHRWVALLSMCWLQ